MLACTCTNTLYERVRADLVPINQNPTSTTARLILNQNCRPVRKKLVIDLILA